MKRFFNFSALFAATLFLGSTMVSCGDGTTDTDATSDTISSSTEASESSSSQKSASAVITASYSDTAVSGTANFTQNNGEVTLHLTLQIPAKADKEVAVHLHEHGDCGDEGMNAHGHWNPTNEDHGKWGAAPFHRGDIGNVKLDAQGNGTLEMTTDLWSIGGSDTTKNILDKAVIVHGGVDDFVSQPTGNAGNRIGCGVIK